jgi:hypothetical protein
LDGCTPLFAPDHAKLTLEARDRTTRRIFFLSHRLGIADKPVCLLPILAAAILPRGSFRADPAGFHLWVSLPQS